MTRSKRAHLVAVTILACVVPRNAYTQTGPVIVFGTLGHPRSSAVVTQQRDEASGYWGGAALEASLGRFELLASASRGALDPAARTASLERDVGEIEGAIAYRLRPWLALEGRYMTRVFVSQVGRQRWDVFAWGIRLANDLGVPGLQGFARGWIAPSVELRDQRSPDYGVAGEAGLRIRPMAFPLVFEVSYRFERYDYPDGHTTTVEEFDHVSIRIGWVIRKAR